jgi:hypothetical protein
MKKLGILTLLSICILLLSNCKRNELDFNKLSDWTVLERELAAPLIKGEISIEKLLENDEDSIIVIDGDTVKLIFSEDSVLYKSVNEFLDIPDQTSLDYQLTHESDILLTGIPAGTRIDPSVVPGMEDLVNDTIFPFNLPNSIRLDSIFLNEGNMVLDITNHFNHELTLIITSVSLFDFADNFFVDSVTNIMPGQTISTSFNIDNYTVRTVLDTNNNSAISIKFTPVLIKGASDVISSTESADLTFGIDQIDDFNSVFGFFGYQTESIDTILEDVVPDELEGFEGNLNVTNPKLRLHYKNSIGVAIALDMNLDLYQNPDPIPTTVDLGRSELNYSSDYLMPEYLDNITFDRTTVPNIDELIALPMPDIINAQAQAYSNIGVDSASTLNWALETSEILVAVEVEVPLEFRADLTYADTIKLSDRDEEENETYEIEFANLHYKFQNYFPFGIGGELVAYDSINDINLGIIDLNPTGGGWFLEPAPVDANGNVIRSQVQENANQIPIDPDLAEDIITTATHLIFNAEFQTTGYGSVSSVRVSADSDLLFQFGIEAKGKYYPEQ